MKLDKKNTLFVSFMLFSMFFGAGNLIFPPFLGHSAGTSAPTALVGFTLTAVVLPVMGVAVVARWGSMENLASQVHPVFSLVYTVLIYLALGPGLAIPRAASVPFEMAVAPYLPGGISPGTGMILYSLAFFAVTLWLSLTPGKMVDRLGKILTPLLLLLLVFLFGAFCLNAPKETALPVAEYQAHPFVKGFSEGYLTMDTLAGLVFGIVMVTTLKNMGFREERSILRCTSLCGILAGALLALVYLMLTFLGSRSSGIYPLGDTGVATLRAVTEQLFGLPGAVLLAVIFTLACLTTCVGLVNSVAAYFSGLSKGRISYKTMAILICIFSFLVCNQGLAAILSISVPILNAVYPAAITLILLGLSQPLWKENPYVYPLTVIPVVIASLAYVLDSLWFTGILGWLPLYDQGFGWVSLGVVGLIISLILNLLRKK